MCVCVCVNKTEKQALQLCIACHCALWQSPVGSSHKTLKLFYPNQCGTSFNKWPSGFKRWKKETQVFKLTFYIENHLFSCVPSGEDMEKKSTASLTLHSSVSTSLWWMTRYNIWQSTSLLICTFTLNLKKKKELYIDIILSLVSLHSYYSLKEMQVFLLLFMHCDILSWWAGSGVEIKWIQMTWLTVLEVKHREKVM